MTDGLKRCVVGSPKEKKNIREKFKHSFKHTAQSVKGPVPAEEGSYQAGLRSSVSSDCKAAPLRLAEVTYKPTDNNDPTNGVSSTITGTSPKAKYSTPIGGETVKNFGKHTTTDDNNDSIQCQNRCARKIQMKCLKNVCKRRDNTYRNSN